MRNLSIALKKTDWIPIAAKNKWHLQDATPRLCSLSSLLVPIPPHSGHLCYSHTLQTPHGKRPRCYKTLFHFPAPPCWLPVFTGNLEAPVAFRFGKNHPRPVLSNVASKDWDVRMGQLFCFSLWNTRILLLQEIKFFLHYFSCFQTRAAVPCNGVRHSLMHLLEVWTKTSCL